MCASFVVLHTLTRDFSGHQPSLLTARLARQLMLHFNDEKKALRTHLPHPSLWLTLQEDGKMVSTSQNNLPTV